MTNKQMIKNELVYLATERNVKACELNQAIKTIETCETYEEMVNVYNEFAKDTEPQQEKGLNQVLFLFDFCVLWAS